MTKIIIPVLSYAEVARRAGVSRQHVRECSLGHRKPGKALLAQMLSLSGSVTASRRKHA